MLRTNTENLLQGRIKNKEGEVETKLATSEPLKDSYILKAYKLPKQKNNS